MATKMSFDPVAKLITLTEDPTGSPEADKILIDVQIDMYSEAKVDWRTDPTLNKFIFPFEQFGGNDLGEGLFAGVFVILRNDLGWRIRPFEQDYELTFFKNLYPKDPNEKMFTPTLGNFKISLFLERSSLALIRETGVSGLTAAETVMLNEIYKLQGLLEGAPLTVTPTSRAVDDISQTITGDGKTTTTVTRDSTSP